MQKNCPRNNCQLSVVKFIVTHNSSRDHFSRSQLFLGHYVHEIIHGEKLSWQELSPQRIVQGKILFKKIASGKNCPGNNGP